MSRDRRRRHRERQLDEAYPEALDLLAVALQAGLLPREALAHLRPAVHPLIAAALDEVARRLADHARLAEALPVLVDHLGTRALSLVATLTTAERTGTAVGPVIDRLADDARTHRRHTAEASARELPVRLAMPLVLCTLPSFVLLAIAPALLGALSALRPA